MEKPGEINEKTATSLFQDSCPEEDAVIGETKTLVNDVIPRPIPERKDRGFTCCVPHCFNNSKRNPNLSFYRIPEGRGKDKKELKKNGCI